MPDGEEFNPRKLDTPLDKMMRSYAGRRSVTRTERKRGRYIQSRPANGKTNDLAFDATIRAAAPFQRDRGELRARNRVAFAIRPTDYMKKIRVRKAANLILFLVDASWSMAVAERMAATKGAIMSLLTDAYQRRDRVGLIVFQKSDATLVLPPTNSVMLAEEALQDIPVGGKTPLSGRFDDGLRSLAQRKIAPSRDHAAVDRAHRWCRKCLDGSFAPAGRSLQYRRYDHCRKRSTAWSSTWNMPLSTRVWRRRWLTIWTAPAIPLPTLKPRACL